MKIKLLVGLAIGLLALGITERSHANLTTIGTADYDADLSGTIDEGETFGLIWDNDNNGNSLIWFDFSHIGRKWSDQKNWAANLAPELTINIFSEYSVDWGTSSWRLPDTVDGPYSGGYGGFNVSTSEMGHLFYTELGLENREILEEELNSSNFDNLIATWYWSQTEYTSSPPGKAWGFFMFNGNQNRSAVDLEFAGLAVHDAQVSESTIEPPQPVPVSGAVWLLGSGLVCLIGTRRRPSTN